MMKGKLIWVAAMLMATIGPSAAKGNPETTGKDGTISLEKTIVALGDSITAGYGVKEKDAYPARLERRLKESGHQWRVINAGISGETSGETLMRLNGLLDLKPTVIILEIGVNDGFNRISPHEIGENIENIIRILKRNGISVVLAGMRMFDNANPDYNAAFASIYPAIAKREDVVLIPFFLEGVAGDPSLNRLDGIHPTAKGYRKVVETVYPYLLRAIEQGKQH
jgi:acyl-CoA thioesterase I